MGPIAGCPDPPAQGRIIHNTSTGAPRSSPAQLPAANIWNPLGLTCPAVCRRTAGPGCSPLLPLTSPLIPQFGRGGLRTLRCAGTAGAAAATRTWSALAGLREEEVGCGVIALALDILFPCRRRKVRPWQPRPWQERPCDGFSWFTPGTAGPRPIRSEGCRASTRSGTREPFWKPLRARKHTHARTHPDQCLRAHLSMRRIVAACALDAWRGVRPRPEPPGLGAGSAGQRVMLSLHTGSPGPRRAHRVRDIAPSPV